MPRCSRCGKFGFFLKLYDSLCDDCLDALHEEKTKQTQHRVCTFETQERADGVKYKGPRLNMITDYQRKKSSDEQLRTFLFSLSTSEYEESFEACGFPFDDGKRDYLDYEADDKMAFHCDRLWEIAGNCKRWIRDCTSPDVFTKYMSLYVSTLEKLKFFETYIIFYEPTPSNQLSLLQSTLSTMECEMVQRSWDSELRKCDKLSSRDSRKKHIKTFWQSFEKYKSSFTTDALSLLDQLQVHSETMDLSAINAPKKAKPEFDTVKETMLLNAYQAAKNEIELHFARNELIGFYYKYRFDSNMLQKCYDYCIEDINSLESLDNVARAEVMRVFRNSASFLNGTDSRRKHYEEQLKRGFCGNIPAFDKLIMIHMNAKEYKKALFYCDMAYKRDVVKGIKESEYKSKKERIKKKLEQQTNS